MTLTAASLGGARAGANPWFIAAAVVVPTFMEVLDTTIAVVALRYIAGGLSATVDDGEWVITSYLAANAIILPISGWLAVRFGRRNYFLFSILVFTVASALCGMATSQGFIAAWGLGSESAASVIVWRPPGVQRERLPTPTIAAPRLADAYRHRDLSPVC